MNTTLWKVKFAALNLLRLMPSWLFHSLDHSSGPVHILFCMVDHYEPGTGNVPFTVEKERMQELLERYPKLSEKHRDFYGNYPKRTWFFPPHYHRNNNLKELVSLCEAGFGEIELHLHHGKSRPDTSDNLRKTIQQCIEEYSHFGIFGTENGEKKYGFIHGNSALDNSRKGKFCGVNNEIDILKETGCYADYTFPCASEANPSKINSIYYASDDPDKPKSYDSGLSLKRNGGPANGLMMVQGPLFPFFKSKSPFGLRLYTPVIDGFPPVVEKRVDAWIRSNIHIQGCGNWIIVKTHTHGAVEGEAVLGDEMDNILSHLERKYNDGKDFFIHYVSARELYNIIKAVEAGEPLTSPEKYRDYVIKKPHYDMSPGISEASEYLKSLVRKTYR